MGENSHNKERIEFERIITNCKLAQKSKVIGLHIHCLSLNQVRQIAQSQHHYSSRLTSLFLSNTYLVLVYYVPYSLFIKIKTQPNLNNFTTYKTLSHTSLHCPPASPHSWQRQFQSRCNGIIHCKITRPLTNHCLFFSYISIF